MDFMRSNKIKDMIRSILPSKNREAARRAKKLTNRALRRGVRADVRTEDAEETSADLMRRAYHADNVLWRRGGDKLNHFMRWCKAITEGMDTQAALDHVREMLPDSLIGDHAYGHWEQDSRRYRYVRRAEALRRRFESFRDSTAFRLRRALVIAPDLHHGLNATIKSRKQPGEPRRLLYGIHDVDAFVLAITPPLQYGYRYLYEIDFPDPFAIERRTTLELIAASEKQKGGRKAALRSCRVSFYGLGPSRRVSHRSSAIFHAPSRWTS
jgi:hypothetical protein